jgi:hypothetical protein
MRRALKCVSEWGGVTALALGALLLGFDVAFASTYMPGTECIQDGQACYLNENYCTPLVIGVANHCNRCPGVIHKSCQENTEKNCYEADELGPFYQCPEGEHADCELVQPPSTYQCGNYEPDPCDDQYQTCQAAP